MNEKEKRNSQQLYDGGLDDELKKERENAKKICFNYNNMDPLKREERSNLIKQLFSKTGKNLLIESSFHCDYGYNIHVGENFYMNHNCVILDCAKVEFGDNVFVGPNCGFYTAGHPIEVKLRNEGLEYAYPIEIGNNVWIGGNVVVLPGVKIGENCVIGAGSVVTKNIPNNSIAFGNPCKVFKNID